MKEIDKYFQMGKILNLAILLHDPSEVAKAVWSCYRDTSCSSLWTSSPKFRTGLRPLAPVKCVVSTDVFSPN